MDVIDTDDNVYMLFLFDKQRNKPNAYKDLDKFKEDEVAVFDLHEEYYEDWWGVMDRCRKIENIFKIKS